ncbi:MAG: hypothetical protein GYA65_12490 [Actinobacteria bacterium]|jgi:hypothetical protein|nr:hypothetical protein [Acidimicrobiaceae bacterium]MBP6488011.1 hypothetical protein [Ilumatobacteraceae bacterium]NMD24991.1 hypothetical protein [Actinomycetota bacterium]MBK9970000.1 hypothetical protein [Acidimicrobiaceae bacterium]MBP8209485.1 hypothetical protein [Ilumatobacteraceae bacterium]
MNARPWLKIVGFELAVLALIGLGIVGLIRGASGPDAPDAMAASPVVTVDLSTVTPAIAADYHYAADHLTDLAQIPCYCGCDHSLGHRNLADCYMTATGAWDAHASGCAVCGNETATAREQLAAGAPIADVRTSIIDQYGPPPSLFSSGASS